jgi:hypothetical protein
MPTIHIRNVPKELHERIQSLAHSQKRTISGQIIKLLFDAVEEEEERQGHMKILSEIRQNRYSYSKEVSDSVNLLREDRDR